MNSNFKFRVVMMLSISLLFTFFSSSVFGESAPQSCVGAWYFDEGTGCTLKDSTGNKNNGTQTTDNYNRDWTLGFDQTSLLFGNNYKDNVRIPATSNYNFTKSSSFTLIGRVKRNNFSQDRWQGVITKGGGNTSIWSDWYGIWISADNKWVFGGAGSSVVQNMVGSSVTDGWHHVAAVQDGAAGKRYLYVDGVCVSTGSAMRATNSADLLVGNVDGIDNTKEYFSGKVDEVYLYNYALSPAQLTPTLYTSLNVLNFTQQPYSNLCWATASAMIISYFNENLTNNRDSIAQNAANSTTNFNFGGTDEQSVKYITMYSGVTGTIQSCLSFSDIKTQISRRGPMFVKISFKDGDGKYTRKFHALCLKGYNDTWGSESVYVINPTDGQVHSYSYSNFLSNSNFDWTRTITFK